MSALERAFERARALNVDLVGLAARIERDGSGATASASAREGTLLDALDALARGERALGEGDHDRAVTAYDECLKKCVKAWMNGRAEVSALVANACGMLEGGTTAKRGECAVVAYRACAGTALSGRAVARLRSGRWCEALRDAEAALDCAPDGAKMHERMGIVLKETEAAGDLAEEYAKTAETLKGKQMNGSIRSEDFEGDSADELTAVTARPSASKCIEEEDWVRARQSMLYGSGVLFAGRDDERMYRDRILFLERAKTIFVMKNMESQKASTSPEADAGADEKQVDQSKVTWLDNAFLLAGFDNLSAYDRSCVCLTIGNVFSWVGHFGGASELYSCGLNVIANSAEDEVSDALDALEPILATNRVLCQLRNDQSTKAWKNVRKLMRDSKLREFAAGFLRIAEVACSRQEWDTAEQSFRIAGRLGAEFQVRHKVVMSRRTALDAKPAMVDVEQLEELDKVQEGTAMEFEETPRFATTPKQNSLNDKSMPEDFHEAAKEIVHDLQEAHSPATSRDSHSSQSKIFTSQGGARSFRLNEVLQDLDGAMSPTRKKRKTRADACSCTEVFSFLGWGSLDIKKSSADEDIFLAALLEAPPSDAANAQEAVDKMDIDDVDLDALVEATTPAPVEVEGTHKAPTTRRSRR